LLLEVDLLHHDGVMVKMVELAEVEQVDKI
jgi:hypothetical protein